MTSKAKDASFLRLDKHLSSNSWISIEVFGVTIQCRVTALAKARSDRRMNYQLFVCAYWCGTHSISMLAMSRLIARQNIASIGIEKTCPSCSRTKLAAQAGM